MDSIRISRTLSRIRDRYIQFMICDQDKKADLLNKLVMDTISVLQISRSLSTLLFTEWLSYIYKWVKKDRDIIFDICRYKSIISIERNIRCPNVLSFKKIVGTNNFRQWNFFLINRENGNSFNQYNAIHQVIYAIIGDKCFCLNNTGTINSLFCKQEKTDLSYEACQFREVIIRLIQMWLYLLLVLLVFSTINYS